MDTHGPVQGTDESGVDDRGWSPRLILSLITLVMVYEAVALGYGMISIALPSIIKYFRTDQGGWLLSAYFLTGAIGAALLGKCADLYGKRRILLVTLTVSGVGAAICAIAPTFEIMVMGRAVQGVIIACMPLCYSLIRDVFPRRLVPFAISVSVTGLGGLAVLTPLLAGWLLLALGFRGMLWFDVAWTLGLAVAIWATTPESPLRRPARVDVVGGLLLGLGVGSLLLVVSRGPRWGWTSTTALLFLGLGVLLLVVYFFQAMHATEPVVNLRLFRRRALVMAAVTSAVAAVFTIPGVLLPLMAVTPRKVGGGYGLGMTTLQYAIIESPKSLCSALAGIAVGMLVTRMISPRWPVNIGMTLWIGASILLAFRHHTLADLIVAALVFGIGHGLLFSSIPNLVVAATPPGDQGSTAGVMQVLGTGFGSVLPVVLFTIMATRAVHNPAGGIVYLEAGLRYGLFLAAGIVFVGLVLAMTVLRSRGEREIPVAAFEQVDEPARPAVTP